VDQRSLKNILKLLSAIGTGISAFFLLPLAVGIYYGEDVLPFAWFDLLFGSFNGVMFLLLYRHRMELSLKEGILSVNLVWLLLGAAGGIPLWLYSDITLMQGVFEAISGFTTTGATVYGNIESLPKMVLMLRSLMHWLGGMGVLVLGVGLLSLINPSGSLALFRAEAPGIRLEKVTPKIKDTALRLWAIYLLLTVVDALLLHWEGMGAFDALNHAFSTISTGGFSTKDTSFGAFATPAILWTTTLFMILSGINFLAHLKLLYGDLQGYRSEETLWYLLLFLFLSASLTIVSFEHGEHTLGSAATHSFFSIASLLTTTGFASLDYEQFGPTAVVLCLVAMLIGGNGGSTAGGPKVIRYVVSAKVIGAEIKRILHPNAVVTFFVDRAPLSETIVSATYGFMMLFAVTNALIVFYLYAAGYDALTAVSASVACVTNVGPGFGDVGPACNYGAFGDLDIAVLSAGMILGRLEFYTFFLMLAPTFWRKF